MRRGCASPCATSRRTASARWKCGCRWLRKVRARDQVPAAIPPQRLSRTEGAKPDGVLLVDHDSCLRRIASVIPKGDFIELNVVPASRDADGGTLRQQAIARPNRGE